MLWFWIVLGCAVVVLLAWLEIRSEKKPAKLSSGLRYGGAAVADRDQAANLKKPFNGPSESEDD
jgi:hypothetical protein